MRQRLLPVLLACGLAASSPGLAGEAKRAAPLLYVTNQRGADVSVIDTATDAQVATLIVAPGPAMIVASPDRNSLYITHPQAGKISILDAHALLAPRLVDVSGSPVGIAVSPDGRLFVTDQDRNLLVVLDGKTGARLAEIEVGPGARRSRRLAAQQARLCR